MPAIIEEEEDTIQPHVTNEKLNRTRYVDEEIITTKIILTEEEPYHPTKIPNDRR